MIDSDRRRHRDKDKDKERDKEKYGLRPVMVCDTLCPAVHI